jgi:hypothetical protein
MAGSDPIGISQAPGTRAYAWSSPIEGSDKRRFFAVLQMDAIKSPQDAVRATIVAEHGKGMTWLQILEAIANLGSITTAIVAVLAYWRY